MHTGKKTKIVATLGPVSDSPEKIHALIQAGVNIFRFNMKHADIAWHNERILRVQNIADSLGVSIGILIDLQGPEIRIETTNAADISLKKGAHIVFAHEFRGTEPLVRIPQQLVFDVLNTGDEFSIDDGFLEFRVIEKQDNAFVAEALDDCVIKHRKGMNIPGKDIDLPSLIDDDLKKLDMAAKTKVDFVALSFSRTKEDIEILREEMKKRNVNAHVVAKIESQQALDHLDDLIEASDAIMVARGDLGIEVPIEELAYWQKLIITKCRIARKPVITATQMLQSMIDNPRPTRAEATDVANAVFDGTDAVMLSGESASGRFPVKAVSAMARIAKFNEDKTSVPHIRIEQDGTTELVVDAAVAMLEKHQNITIDAVIVFTETGHTARAISSFRPKVPIIAVTDHQKTVETLTLSYGVISVFAEFPSGSFESAEGMLHQLKKSQHIREGQTVLIIHGVHWKQPGLTNSLSIVKVA
ncbi:MAG: pyruvate kinase [Candidatus Pacebacteria bacterium]|nr:pyruvate kinase [Candidatus Paceibacterota bacterium]